jgi:hypothetical protein
MPDITLQDAIQLTAKLSEEDRRRLLLHLQAGDASEVSKRPSWFDIRGKATHPTCGEDAQAWVSRSRREDQEQSDRILGHDPS